VGTAPGINQRALADVLLVPKDNVCQLLDRMEAAGQLVRRREGRRKHLFLIDAGRSLFTVVVPAHEALIAELLSALSPEEQGEFFRPLRTLDRAVPD
jgi:DNA-binding MarR family transcriptional regulator